MLDKPQQPLAELEITEEMAEFASTGQMPIFPGEAIQQLALDLGRRLDCYVPTTQCEGAVVSFVLELASLGWKVFLPVSDLRS